MTCAEIKNRLTLREAARLAGHDLPERDGVRFCSPLRPDRHPSCTIKDEVFADWSTGQHLDAIAFYAAARGLETSAAVHELGDKLGGGDARPAEKRESIVHTKSEQLFRKDTRPGVMFEGREGADEDFSAILAARRLPDQAADGLHLAHYLRVLHFAEVGGFACWLVSDESRKLAEARRLDGEPFPAVGTLGERKAHTLRGSVKSWPVGLLPRLSADRHRRVPIVLVEGGPDLLAAFAVLSALPMSERDFLPVAMLGSAATIGPDAIEILSRREVVIIAQGDKAGAEASQRWAGQLTKAACTVRVRELPEGLDLNDAVTRHGLKACIGIVKL
jgi:fermentation-respiration switch protein FrsA (DUF1100 family)